MGANAAVHPSDETLRSYGQGKLDQVASESVDKHLADCALCKRRAAEMSSDSFLGRLRDAQGQPGTTGPVVSSLDGPSIPGTGPHSPAPPPIGMLPPGLAGHPDYEVVRELGQGGMGTVYLAKNTLMGRHEVLKVVSSHMMNRVGALDRFLSEIRLAARLQHANIVTAYSAMRLGESIVFAMEYVEGLDLSKLVKANGPLPISNACSYIHQAALGLQHASEHGMVHRDIKPSNLMLAKEGDRAVIKVFDFGLAKVKSEGAVDGGQTHEGQMLGTPDYIAPEQIRDARRADTRADIYSLGCTLYYLLTGGPPFHATSLYEILQAHHSMDALPLNLARPAVPVELAALVARMMAKEPERRFQTPKDVARALLPFFKKAAATATGSKAEMSQPEGPDQYRALTPEALVAGSDHAKRTAAFRAIARDTVDQAPRRAARERLIGLNESRPSDDEQPAPAVSGGSLRLPLWIWPWVAAAVLAVGLIVGGTVVIRMTTAGKAIVVENALEHPIVDVAGTRIVTEDRKPDEKPATPSTKASREEVRVLVYAGREEVSRAAPAREAGGGSARTAAAGGLDAVRAAKVSSPRRSVENSIGMTLTLIPPGEFLMGSPDDDKDAADRERPQHKVGISPFYLGVTEVTQAQYDAVMGDNPSHFCSTGDGKDKVAGRPTGQYPVEYVRWTEAARFCDTLSEKEGRTPFYAENEPNKVRTDKNPGYRLPTEAEWEYACRAGTTTRYCSGPGLAKLANYAWFGAHAGGMTHAVGEKHPNAFGLYDMHGNVREWCSDWLDEAYYQHAPVSDPQGPSIGLKRVVRGGSWRNRAPWPALGGAFRPGAEQTGRRPWLSRGPGAT